LLGYSPYHNIKEGENYPAVLVLTAKEDDRVHPMHSYKFIARLQEANSSDNPILLRVEEKAGHGGPPAVSNVIEEFTDVYSFLFWQLGIDK
jgi:prolyl oligopeptidase